MCWGERVENQCPIDHSIEVTIRWFGCQYGHTTRCSNPFLAPHRTNVLCSDCQTESDFANDFRPEPRSPSIRDWETFKSEFRRDYTPIISEDYTSTVAPAPPEVPTMIQNLAGEDTELPSYANAMQDAPRPPTWLALYGSHTPYQLGHASSFATFRLNDLHQTLTPLFHRLQRLRSRLLPNTQTSATVTYIREALQGLESQAETNLRRAEELEQQAADIALAVGFMVSLELQQQFLDTDLASRHLFMHLVDDTFGNPWIVRRRFDAWISDIESNGEFRGRNGRAVATETTPLLPFVHRGSLVEIAKFDVGDFYCVVFGASAWFGFLWVLWLTFG